MSLLVGTGKAPETDVLLDAIQRGRNDHQFFSRFFLNRTLHDGQLHFVENAEATVNALACANRFGKTFSLSHIHYHAATYKTGGESRYLNDDGIVDMEAFVKLRYRTLHSAGEWEQAALVWDEMLKLRNENPILSQMVTKAPRSKPPYINLLNGQLREVSDVGGGRLGD